MDEALQQLQDLQLRTERTLHNYSSSIPLPIFDEKISFASFIMRFNDYINAKQLDEEDAFRLLPLCLRGTSRDAYEQLSVDLRKKAPGINY